MEWQPIETAPQKGEFLAEDLRGNWIKVERYDDPFRQGVNAVINRDTGKWWYAKRWAPLPKISEKA